jgi:hypothetical protein
MRLISVLALLSFGAVSSVPGGSADLPPNYQVQFENAWVKVTSVRYEPFQKLPAHAHTPTASAYVYLNDGPPVKFRHIGGHNTVATRPSTRAGAFRVYRGLDEVHEVENTGGAPSEFLRVELKTAGVEPAAFRGKFERPAGPATQPLVQFDHPQLRVSRVWAPPGADVEIAAGADPAMVIALGRGAGFAIGETRWVPASNVVRLSNATASTIDFLRFDFRTPPGETAARSRN